MQYKQSLKHSIDYKLHCLWIEIRKIFLMMRAFPQVVCSDLVKESTIYPDGGIRFGGIDLSTFK